MPCEYYVTSRHFMSSYVMLYRPRQPYCCGPATPATCIQPTYCRMALGHSIHLFILRRSQNRWDLQSLLQSLLLYQLDVPSRGNSFRKLCSTPRWPTLEGKTTKNTPSLRTQGSNATISIAKDLGTLILEEVQISLIVFFKAVWPHPGLSTLETLNTS